MISYEDMLKKLREDKNSTIKNVCKENKVYPGNFYRYLRSNGINTKTLNKEDKKQHENKKEVRKGTGVAAGYTKYLKIKKLIKQGISLLDAIEEGGLSTSTYYYYKNKMKQKPIEKLIIKTPKIKPTQPVKQLALKPVKHSVKHSVKLSVKPSVQHVVHKKVSPHTTTALMPIPQPSKNWPATFVFNMDKGNSDSPKIMMVIGDPEALAKFVGNLR